MTHPFEGDSQDFDSGIRGLASLNHATTTQGIYSDFSLNPGHIDPSRDQTYGNLDPSVQYVKSKGGYELTGTHASLETVRLLRYRPGGLLIAGQMLIIRSVPADGVYEAGLGRLDYLDHENNGNFTPGDNEVFLRLDSTGSWSFVIKREGLETEIPRDGPNLSWNPAEHKGTVVEDENGNESGQIWAFDAFDGSGPSDENRTGLDLEPPVCILPKIFGTYYGKGPFILSFEAVGPNGYQRPWPALVFQTSDEQSVLTQPNQPLMARYDDRDSGTTETLEVYGRQGSRVGEFEDNPITPFHMADGKSIPTATAPVVPSDADLMFAYRRKPDSAEPEDTNYRGTEFGLLNLQTFTNQRSLWFNVLNPSFGGQTPDWGPLNDPTDDVETPIQYADEDDTQSDLTSDPTTGDKSFGGEIIGSGKNQTQLAKLTPLDQPTPRNAPIGVFAVTLTETADSDAEWVPTWEVLH